MVTEDEKLQLQLKYQQYSHTTLIKTIKINQLCEAKALD